MDDDDVSEEIEIIEYDDNVNIIDRIVIQNIHFVIYYVIRLLRHLFESIKSELENEKEEDEVEDIQIETKVVRSIRRGCQISRLNDN